MIINAKKIVDTNRNIYFTKSYKYPTSCISIIGEGISFNKIGNNGLRKTIENAID